VLTSNKKTANSPYILTSNILTLTLLRW